MVIFMLVQNKDNQKGWYLVRSVSPNSLLTTFFLPDSNISHFKLYTALFPLKWLICIPNISAVRWNVVFETLHDFYRTAINKGVKKCVQEYKNVCLLSWCNPVEGYFLFRCNGKRTMVQWERHTVAMTVGLWWVGYRNSMRLGWLCGHGESA